MSDISVLVSSRGGNTSKVADAIAEELGVKAIDIKASSLGGATIIFLGSGTYGGKPDASMLNFIESNNFAGRKVALFGTSWNFSGRKISLFGVPLYPFGSEKMILIMSDALKRKGATILGNYHCAGKFLLFNRGRPNKKDLDNARKFAGDMLKLS